MTIEKINKRLKDDLVWTFTDFFYAYCEGKGIENPEEDLTEEEYDALEKECAEKMTHEFMSRFIRKVSQNVDAMIATAMETL